MSTPTLQDLEEALPGLLLAEYADAVQVGRTWSVARGTAQAFVDAVDGDGRVFVTVRIPLASDVPATPDLFEFVALRADDFLFGHLSCERTPRETAAVFLSHTLLGDFLQRGEVLICLESMLSVADTWDELLVKRFGGRPFRTETSAGSL